MFRKTFLRDESDSSGSEENKELESQDLDAETQGSERADPSKKGLSDAEKEELENLRKEKEAFASEKENYEKRLKDTQTSFHENQRKLAELEGRVSGLMSPTEKKGEFDDDPGIQKIDQDIKYYQEQGWDYRTLEIDKQARIDILRTQKMLNQIQGRLSEQDDLGRFLAENPDAEDLSGAGKSKAELESRGEKISTETAYFYNLGKNKLKETQKEYEARVQAEVKKRLEAIEKGKGAINPEGEFVETTPEEDEEKQKKAYLDHLMHPSGLDIQ